MQKRRFILAIDQGTTGTKIVIYDETSRIISQSYQEITCYYPKVGWVEHNPQEIWKSCLVGIKEAIQKSRINTNNISAIAITNQRETVLIWDRLTGQSVGNAIVWQCRRTASFCDELRRRGLGNFIKKKTGLLIDAYFSATKIRWILDNLSEVRKKAEKGEIICGTIDSWLVWKLTGGKVHLTDYTNASRTMLFNIHQLAWDPELLELFNIPTLMLPSVRASGEIYGYTASHLPLNSGIPIAALLGDQQAALFGQACF
ncbi:glycerol kinase, partial [Candidatus Aerophobetes bacterium]